MDALTLFHQVEAIMLRRVLLSTVLGLLLSLSTTSAQTAEYLTILHLNDTHSNLAPGAPRDAEGNATVGGIARAASVIGMEKMMDPNALLLHAGDVYIGDLSFNLSLGAEPPVVPELQMLQQLGVDAMALGNHEFDLGCEILAGTLQSSLGQSPFPLLCGNLDMSAEPEQLLSGLVTPHVILNSGNLKVGVFGMVTPEVAMIETAQLLHGAEDYEALFGLIGQQVMELQAADCDVIIFLSHLGYALDMAAAASVPGIHLIVGGHDHLALTEATPAQNAAGTTYIVQSGAFYRQMGKTKLKIDNGAVTLEEYMLIPLDAAVAEYEDMKTACEGLYAQLDLAIQGLLFTDAGVATGFLTEAIDNVLVEGNLDTHVGNLCADAFMDVCEADVAFQPGGSTAQPIYPGIIKGIDVFRTIGYGMNEENGMGFPVVTVEMTGEAIYAGLEVTLSFDEMYDEMLIHPSDGFAYTFNPEAEKYARVTSVTLDGAPLDPEATYTVAFNQLLLMYFDFLGSLDPRITYENLQIVPSERMTGPMTELEALAGWISQQQPLSPDPLPGRVTGLVTSIRDVPTQPASPVLLQNYPNPFRAFTAVRMRLPASTHARVSVFDVMGREVTVLADADFSSGWHELQFPAHGLPPGLYQCRLVTEKNRQSIPMLLMK
jgi:5'-nucleotidase